MTFDTLENSRNEGRPFHLYKFKFGPASGDEVYYTNVSPAVVFDSKTFEPLAITHGEIVSSGNLDKSALPVTVPEDSLLAALYTYEAPSYVVTLTIWQGHIGDSDYKVCWAGRVTGASFVENQLELNCEPVISSLRRTGLTRDYQYHCPLVLYGAQCRASRVAATRTASVSSVSGVSVTLPNGWAPADLKAKHIGGIAEWTNDEGRTERRSIINVATNVLTLSSFPTDLETASVLTVVLGCNHLMTDCRDVHDNILNFGGQPQIPLKNPIGITNGFY